MFHMFQRMRYWLTRGSSMKDGYFSGRGMLKPVVETQEQHQTVQFHSFTFLWISLMESALKFTHSFWCLYLWLVVCIAIYICTNGYNRKHQCYPQCCINNMAKSSEWSVIISDILVFAQFSGYPPLWIHPTSLFELRRDKKDGVDFAKLFTLRENRRTSDPVLSRDRGKLLQLHPWRLGSEALRLLQR